MITQTNEAKDKEYVVLEHLMLPDRGLRFCSTPSDNNTHGFNGELWYKEVGFTDTHEEALQLIRQGPGPTATMQELDEHYSKEYRRLHPEDFEPREPIKLEDTSGYKIAKDAWNAAANYYNGIRKFETPDFSTWSAEYFKDSQAVISLFLDPSKTTTAERVKEDLEHLNNNREDSNLIFRVALDQQVDDIVADDVVAILKQLKNSDNINPCWQLYRTGENGLALFDANAKTWRAQRIPSYHPLDAYTFLSENKIDFTDLDNVRHNFN